MGFNSENSDAFVLDLETTARAGIEAILDPVDAPANYKDADKIAAKKAEKLAALIERAALDINLNRIVCIGTWTPSFGANVVTIKDEAEEMGALAALALQIDSNRSRKRVITFNGLGFDLLVLMQRARILGIKFPILDLNKYRSPNTDLMNVLTFDGAVARHSLDFYCKVFGIDYAEDALIKAVSGADIPKLVEQGSWDLIEGHCRYDVIRTGLLAQRLGVLS